MSESTPVRFSGERQAVIFAPSQGLMPSAACLNQRTRSSPPPLGAMPPGGGVNFSISYKNAAGITLLLFDGVDDEVPSPKIRIDPSTNGTYHYWHVFVRDLSPGQLYSFRIEGPSDPADGMRFNRTEVLMHPYGRGVVFRMTTAASPMGRPKDHR